MRDTARIPGMPSRRVLIALLVGGVGLSLLVALNRPATKGPALAKSCNTPAVALESVTTGGGSSLRYAITGPSTGTYILTVDAKTARVQGDGAAVTPARAIAVAVRGDLKGCTADGTLPTLPAGAREVELFRDGHRVASARLPS